MQHAFVPREVDPFSSRLCLPRVCSEQLWCDFLNCSAPLFQVGNGDKFPKHCPCTEPCRLALGCARCRRVVPGTCQPRGDTTAVAHNSDAPDE
eukprot:2167086-Amphidinium_carterae.1